MRKASVLFVCGRNAGRSQMGAAFFNHLADPARAEAFSAGLDPAPRVHPEVIEVMREVGIDLSGVEPIELTARMYSDVQFLVTMGCGESCPLVPASRRADWVLPDPAGQPLQRVREIRDDIRQHVTALVEERGWSRAGAAAATHQPGDQS